MLNSSHNYHQTLYDTQKRGIDGSRCSYLYHPSSNLKNRHLQSKAKDDAVQGLTTGIELLFMQNKSRLHQRGSLLCVPYAILVQFNEDSKSAVEAKNVIIATGSDITPFPGDAIEIDEEQIINLTGALSLQKVTGKMVFIGGGIIELEMGSVWSRIGSEVTVVEFLNSIGGCWNRRGNFVRSLIFLFSVFLILDASRLLRKQFKNHG